MPPTILLVAMLVILGAEGSILSIGHDRDLFRIDPELHQIALRRLGTFLTQY